jgi:hypothetical protein
MKAIMYKINHSTLTLPIACLLAGKLNLKLNPAYRQASSTLTLTLTLTSTTPTQWLLVVCC